MEYHIFLGTDASYLPQTAVLIYSILTAARDSDISVDGELFVFHILADRLGSDDKTRLEKFSTEIAATFPTKLMVHDTDTSDFNAFKGWTENESRSTYLRFLIPRFIGDDVSKVLYLDADMICYGDLRELFRIDLAGHTVGAVCDVISPHAIYGELCLKSKKLLHRRARIQYAPGESYFNAGMLLIDLKLWRKNRISERSVDILRNYVTPMCDQDALNLCLKGDVKQLSARWNLMWPLTFIQNAPLLESSKAIHDPIIRELILSYAHNKEKASLMHFAGFVKPWRSGRFVFDNGNPSPSLMAIKHDYLTRAAAVPIFGEFFKQLLKECNNRDPVQICIQLGIAVTSWLAHDRLPALDKGLRRGLRQRAILKGLMVIQAVELIVLGCMTYLVLY